MADNQEMRKAQPGEVTCAKDGCPIVPYQDSKFCKAHGGALEMMQKNNQQTRNYILTKCKFRKNIVDKANSTGAHSLRDEIAILRFMLENTLENLEDNNDLELKSLAISNMVLKIDKLVSSSIKAEIQLGELLSADVLMLVMQQIIAIVSKYISDTDILDSIAIDVSKIDVEQHLLPADELTEMDII
jgi:hypothetical protein